MSNFEPKILVFCCNWCSYAGADLAGTSRLKIKPNFRVIRTMCSGRLDPSFVFHAFARGADGVLVAGCHPGDCHYSSGNYKARRRVSLLHNVLPQLGIESERLRLEWISASEGTKFRDTVNEFIDQITQLGPLHSNGKGEVKAGEAVEAKGN
jgi:F420-non-reducing hydrogenase iron-sulfur subunit